jgi:hypothetical protein
LFDENRYSAKAYSSTTGRDMRALEGTQHAIRICVCGKPVSSVISGGRTGRGTAESCAMIAAFEGTGRIQKKMTAD